MATENTTVGDCVEADKADAVPSDPDQNLTEMTRCLTDTYTARARLRLKQGEVELAVADLNEALRLAPDHHEARRLLEELRDQPNPTMQGSVVGESGGRPVKAGSNSLQGRFRAGYLVSARYDSENDRDDQVLASFPLTTEGLRQAIEYARRMCSEESWRERRSLYEEAYWSHAEHFDAVVTEVRSIVRQVHLEMASVEDGRPLID